MPLYAPAFSLFTFFKMHFNIFNLNFKNTHTYMLLLSWALYFLNDFIHTHVSYASLHMGRCVFACLSVCEQTSRSAEVQLAMTLLCLIGTAVTVTFRNAMNQCQGGTGRQTKNNQLYSIQIDTGWTGQRERERWRHAELTPRTNKHKRMRPQTDRGPSGL